MPANYQDVNDVVEGLLPILTKDLGGSERTDLGIILDAADIIGNHGMEEIFAREGE